MTTEQETPATDWAELGFGAVEVVAAAKPKPAQYADPTSDAAAVADLEKAISRLKNGQPKAAMRSMVDAVNRIAAGHGIHGWARC